MSTLTNERLQFRRRSCWGISFAWDAHNGSHHKNQFRLWHAVLQTRACNRQPMLELPPEETEALLRGLLQRLQGLFCGLGGGFLCRFSILQDLLVDEVLLLLYRLLDFILLLLHLLVDLLRLGVELAVKIFHQPLPPTVDVPQLLLELLLVLLPDLLLLFVDLGLARVAIASRLFFLAIALLLFLLGLGRGFRNLAVFSILELLEVSL
mmetsp:Transcript_19589/g.74130  ORF Transcript_19589/g.74130 Transcript_19589/m.74130 type:complete len:208 (-) Transcript_19589:788-1411(-)